MKVDRKWLWIGGAVVGAGAALALGVPLGTLLIVAALLACPAAMYLGMRGTHQGAGGMACHPGTYQAQDQQASPRDSTGVPSGSEEAARKA